MNGLLNLHPKVAGTGLASALALIILFVVGHWWVVPINVSSAFTAVLAFAGGYFAPMLTAPPPPPPPKA